MERSDSTPRDEAATGFLPLCAVISSPESSCSELVSSHDKEPTLMFGGVAIYVTFGARMDQIPSETASSMPTAAQIHAIVQCRGR